MCARVKTVSRLTWNRDNTPLEVALETLYVVGQKALEIAMENIPLETGTLRRSGTVTIGALPNANDIFDSAFGVPNQGIKGLPQADVFRSRILSGVTNVYVTYSTPYAVRLHEDTSWEPRNWKYSYRNKYPGIFKAGYVGGPSRRYGFEGMFFKKVPKPAVGGPRWLRNAMPKAWGQLSEILVFVRNKRGAGRRRAK